MFFSITILAISLSLDALGVGIVYGLRCIKIPLIPKLVICFFSIFYSAISLAIGSSLATKIPSSISKLFGVAILIGMGIWFVTQAWVKKENNSVTQQSKTRGENTGRAGSLPTEAETICKFVIKSLGITIHVIRNPAEFDIDRSGVIDIKESILLGLALSVDAIGAGIGSGLIGFHSLLIPFMIGLFQLTFLYIGADCGERFAFSIKKNEKLISFLPGILLIILAIVRIY